MSLAAASAHARVEETVKQVEARSWATATAVSWLAPGSSYICASNLVMPRGRMKDFKWHLDLMTVSELRMHDTDGVHAVLKRVE